MLFIICLYSIIRHGWPYQSIFLNNGILLHLWAVHIEPPVTDKILLVEEGPVGAEKAELERFVDAIWHTDVKLLAFTFGIRIVANLPA